MNNSNLTSSTRVITSGVLAITLWLGTAIVIGSHLYTVVDLSHKLSSVKAGTVSSKEGCIPVKLVLLD